MATLVIHTGGTIGMVRTKDGFAPQEGVVEEFLTNLSHEATTPATVDIQPITPLIDSANAAPADWDRIASAIVAAYDRYDAFVVTHGTDTLAYTAAALCFALEGLNKPVVVTGAMLPLTIEGTDGARNLTDALRSANTAPPGVWVQFAGRLLHGARVRKSHSRAFDAFAADPSDTAPVQSGKSLTLHRTGRAQLAVLAVTPGMSDELLAFAAARVDGLVLRCYGSGTAPETLGLSEALRTATTRGVPVVAVSQCPEGGMALGTYAAAAILRRNGVIDGRDMTVEAAYAKLTYVLARSSDPAQRTLWLTQALCGEFTP